MNKLYFQITSLLIVVILGTAWVFNFITLEVLGAGATTLLAFVYGIFQNYEKTQVKNQMLELKNKLNSKENDYNLQLIKFNKVKIEHEELLKDISINFAESVVNKEIKPKKRYYKPKQ